jgi:hypothetical protein
MVSVAEKVPYLAQRKAQKFPAEINGGLTGQGNVFLSAFACYIGHRNGKIFCNLGYDGRMV